MTNRLIGFGITLAILLVSILVVCFLGGLASAFLEVRREKKAGQVPTRPAWENRDKRRAVGGFLAQIKGAWQSATHRGVKSCWCQMGPIAYFEALDSGTPAGYGCAAWELGDPTAIRRHDSAGGYARTPA